MSNSILDKVNPFIGVDGQGRCLVGPYLPNGLVRPGPDNPPPHGTTGYSSTRPILRFSNTHVSGTGGKGRYGNIAFTPYTGEMTTFVSASAKSEEESSVGYYAVRLVKDDILVELTATERCAIHRYRFPANGEQSCLFLDLGAVIQSYPDTHDLCPKSIGGFVASEDGSFIVGRGDYQGGWGHASPYSIYFAIAVDRPAKRHCFAVGQSVLKGTRVKGANCRIMLAFAPGETVTARVGISHVSVEHAKRNLEQEAMPCSFEDVRAQASEAWDRLLSRIRVRGGTTEQQELFYTSLYRLYCMPGDMGIDDEHAAWTSGVRQFNDFYCLWDSVRNANSLLALIDPDLERDFCNALLDIAEHTGWLPDAWIAGHSAHIQGGSSADIMISEACLKGIEGIDYRKALSLIRKNAESVSPDPHLHGRHAEAYGRYGYLPASINSCVSKTIEYGYQDWCIARLAEALGEDEVAQRYRRQSQGLWKLWRKDKLAFCPRNEDGSWIEPYEPSELNRDYYRIGNIYHYEGTPWEWDFSALHDMDGLIERHGGAEAFEKHLDRFFNGHLAMWKEIVLHTPYLYHYVGRPDRSSIRARSILFDKYSATTRGLPDNEDMGSHSSYVICTSMGLYPVYGQDLYCLTAPVFEEIEIDLKDGATLTIKAPGANDKNHYITKARLNGQPLDSAWVRHKDIAQGGVIELTVSDKPEGLTLMRRKEIEGHE